MGKVHGSLARAGKVKGQTPKIDKIEKKKQPRGRCVWYRTFSLRKQVPAFPSRTLAQPGALSEDQARGSLIHNRVVRRVTERDQRSPACVFCIGSVSYSPLICVHFHVKAGDAPFCFLLVTADATLLLWSGPRNTK